MGIKKNFIFSTVLTVSNYIFPLIVYPYVARVLGANNIGICNFVDNIINYAMMVSMMGIAVVGVREISKARGDRRALDETFTSLFTLCTAFTVLSTVLLVGAVFAFEQLQPYRCMLLIGLLKLWGNFLLIDWLYRGLEDFRYITMRTILVKLGYVVCVFIFVHRPGDYITYYLLMCLMVTVNAVFNCIRAVRIVRLRLRWADVAAMFGPFAILGVYILLNSMYTTLNVVYLGVKFDDVEVGYYTTATKIFYIILAVYTAYSGVVMPRVSSLLAEGRHDEFRALIGKSMQALILIAVPTVIFTMMYSSGLIYLLVGESYEGAIVPMTIVMPLIFIIGYEQILVVQTLTPLATDRIILMNSVIGATVGIVGNIVLVGRYAAVGSAIVWVVAEIVVLLLSQYFVTKKVGIRFPLRDMAANIGAYLPYIAISALIIRYLPGGDIVKMLVGGCLCAVYFAVVQQTVLKNPLFMDYSAKLAKKIRRA